MTTDRWGCDKMWGTERMWGMSETSCRANGGALFVPAGVVCLRSCARSVLGYKSVCAHGMEGARRIRQRANRGDCPDSRRIPLAGYGSWFDSLRRSSWRSVATLWLGATPQQFHNGPAGRARRHSLDWHVEGACQL